MKKTARATFRERRSDPVKMLLHMVQIGDDWAGKVTCFKGGEEYVFNNLDDLFAWLRRAPAIRANHSEREVVKRK